MGRDSFVGYGVVEKIEMLWGMPPRKEDYSRVRGWKCGLTFRGPMRFAKPYLNGKSSLSIDSRRGAFLNSAKLAEEQVYSILEAAEDSQGEG